MKLYTVGCSFTEGTGVRRENNYTSRLARHLGYIPENHAAAGHSNKYIFRKTIEILKNWNNNNILIVQWTNPVRDEIITKEGYLFQPPSHNWTSLEFLYGINPGLVLQEMGIHKDELDKKIIDEKESKVLDYCYEFFNREYQLHLSFCFQFALWGLLEKMGIKYLMFFGWEFEDFENQKQIFSFTNEKFLKEVFGEYTNTENKVHPDSDAHGVWAEFLYKKIKELNYITTSI